MTSLQMSFSSLKFAKNRYGISDLFSSVNIENLKNINLFFTFPISIGYVNNSNILSEAGEPVGVKHQLRLIQEPIRTKMMIYL